MPRVTNDVIEQLAAERDWLRSALSVTHAGAPGRINLDERAKSERQPLFVRLDEVNAEISVEIRRAKERAYDAIPC